MFHIISAFAEFERNIIGERTTFGMERKFREGGAITKPPLGYKMVDKKLLIEPEKAGKIKEMFNEFLTEEISLNKLAKRHNLSVNGLKKVLSNQSYLGNVKFAGKVSEGEHEAIINREMFEKIQKKLRKWAIQIGVTYNKKRKQMNLI